MPPPDDPVAVFDRLRPRLLRIAHRMLGSRADAEDVVQEAFIRWHRLDRAGVEVPQAYLTRMVSRLCLDVLKSARRRRESYVGTWLPEPAAEPFESEAEDVSLHLMVALERLSPLERAAFLLHDVFDMSFEEVATAIGREAAACRQLASRARSHVRAARPRFLLPKERGLAIAEAFFAAARSGDVAGLTTLLADDVVLYADGGGKATAVLNPIRSRAKVERLFAGISRKAEGASFHLLALGIIDGLPGFLARDWTGTRQATFLVVDGDRIGAIYVLRNPDKLRALPAFDIENENGRA